MKRVTVLLIVAFVAILSACSNEISLQLAEANADIVRDATKTGSLLISEESEKELIPTALYYTFSIKNNGMKVGGKDENYINVQIVPNEGLVTASKDVLGYNVFEPADHPASNNFCTGYGNSHSTVLEKNEMTELMFYYYLGCEEEQKDAQPVPSKDQLEKLKEHALDATLIIMLDNEEIARFDLNDIEPNKKTSE